MQERRDKIIKMQNLSQEVSEMQQMQESATKLLNFYVGDLLCLVQIDKGVLLKNISGFNIKTAVEEVMMVQKEMAESKRIDLYATYEGFG
jgi:hypothetical protein